MTLLTLKDSPEEINKSFYSLTLRMKSQLSSASRIYYTLVLCVPWALTLKSPLLTCWFSCSSLLLRSHSQFRLFTLLFSFPAIYLSYWAEKSTCKFELNPYFSARPFQMILDQHDLPSLYIPHYCFLVYELGTSVSTAT